MSSLCLAEAQAVIAYRASQRGGSAALEAALWAGAADLYGRAQREVRDHAGDHAVASERLRRCLAIGNSLSMARAHKSLAQDLHKQQLAAGAAERACVEAAGLLNCCAGAADCDMAWREVVAAEGRALERVR